MVGVAIIFEHFQVQFAFPSDLLGNENVLHLVAQQNTFAHEKGILETLEFLVFGEAASVVLEDADVGEGGDSQVSAVIGEVQVVDVHRDVLVRFKVGGG